MRDILQPRESLPRQRRLVLGGPGGMGKTQLAITFATQYDQENSSVLWLDASSEDPLKDSFRIMAEAVFDVREPTVLTGDQSLKYISRWLSDRRDARWLLIFDN